MLRRLCLPVFALVCVSVAAQVAPVARRPVLELGQALARFKNGTSGFTDAELKRKVIGFAQAATGGEFALAYFEDRGDDAIHGSLRLAISTAGQAWKRAEIAAPAEVIDAVTALFIGKDYLLLNTGLNSATRQVAVFSKSLAFQRATGGALAVAPLANDTVVISENRPPQASAVRTTFALFDVHTGVVRPLYPGATPAAPSPSYRKLLTKLVADLNAAFPKGNGGKGYKEDWYAALAIQRPEYDAVRDTMTFTETIAPTWPLPALPTLSSQVETFVVSCAPMTKPTRRCIEGTRTIAPLARPGGR